MTEKQFEASVVAYLKTRGCVIKMPRTRFTKAGVSDLLMCFNGRFIAIELKRPKGVYGITAAQEYFLTAVRAAGGIGGVARSLDDVKAILEEAL